MSQSQDYDQPRSASLAVNDDDDNASVTSEVNGALFASHGVAPLVDGEDEPLEADLETQGLLRVAVELYEAEKTRAAGAEKKLALCMKNYSVQLKQTHWMLVGFAGVEMRESNKQTPLRAADASAYMLAAYVRWIDVYEGSVIEGPPGARDMFKMPA
jgi:hypothetical protein